MPTFDTPEPISVSLDVGMGDIRVVASDRTDTVVEVRPSDPAKASDVTYAEHTRVEYANGRLLVKTPKWKWSFRSAGESIDVQVELPAGSQVSGETGVAALHSTGRIGGCRFRTGVGDIQLDHAGPLELKAGAGDITVERAAGDAQISTGSGAVAIGSIDGAAVIKNSNGATWVGRITGDARVNAANGRITIDRAGAAATVKTANGDLRLGEVERGAVIAESANGKIDVGIRDGVAAWLDLKTAFGNVHNDLKASDRPTADEVAVDVRARTSYGDITIRRSHPEGLGTDEA